MAQTFIKPRLMRWNNNAITDHNRSSLAMSVERIEKATRMANGTMRKYVIADKTSFTVSWDELPNVTQYTVDGFWGGRAMETFYRTTPGSFVLEITEGDSTVKTFNVMFTDFSYSIVKRGRYDTWTVNVTMEEV